MGETDSWKGQGGNTTRLVLPIRIPAGPVTLEGHLCVPDEAEAVIVFAHGAGSSRFSPRNQRVAHHLRQAGFGTLLMDLLAKGEEEEGPDRFDADRFAARLEAATGWILENSERLEMGVGYFGSSTGAAVALAAAADLGRLVGAVVSRGGRPDLAGPALPGVRSPTLLIVGGNDRDVLGVNRRAFEVLQCPRELSIVPGAGHLFEEPGALDQVADLAVEWFRTHLLGVAAAHREGPAPGGPA